MATVKASKTIHSNVAKRRGKMLVLGLFGIIIVGLLWSFAVLWNSSSSLSSSQQIQPIHTRPSDSTVLRQQTHQSRAQENTFAGFFSTIPSLTDDMPPWMKDYFAWHAAERIRLEQNHENWASTRFLVLQCLPGSRKCGGTADRLKPLPLMLWVAHKSQRLLLIKWGRPAELEEFLLPPQGGMDWRVPLWLWGIPEFRQGPRATNVEELLDFAPKEELEFRTIKARVQSHDHGMSYYNTQRYKSGEHEDEPTFQDVYHVMWRAMFTPSPPIAKLVEEQLRASRLVPGNYVGIHVRALYAVTDRDPGMVKGWVHNAINCASQLQPGGPFFLSSDSSHAVVVGHAYGQERGVLVASRSVTVRDTNQSGQQSSSNIVLPEKEPYHLDKAPRSAKASDFYDTFVDLYLLAMSRCVTYNMGGYGTWALFISPYANRGTNSVCAMQHHEASGMHTCEWVTPPMVVGESKATTTSVRPLFHPPMP